MPGEAPMLATARWRTAQDSMRELLLSRRKQYSLAQPFYGDPGFFDLDLQGIFYRRWLFAGAVCEIAEPGQYFTVDIGPTSVIVVRDRTGAIRAFYNTCRHRGSRICTTAKGRAKAFVCPYHQW